VPPQPTNNERSLKINKEPVQKRVRVPQILHQEKQGYNMIITEIGEDILDALEVSLDSLSESSV
jgi:hypothetical protein